MHNFNTSEEKCFISFITKIPLWKLINNHKLLMSIRNGLPDLNSNKLILQEQLPSAHLNTYIYVGRYVHMYDTQKENIKENYSLKLFWMWAPSSILIVIKADADADGNHSPNIQNRLLCTMWLTCMPKPMCVCLCM